MQKSKIFIRNTIVISIIICFVIGYNIVRRQLLIKVNEDSTQSQMMKETEKIKLKIINENNKLMPVMGKLKNNTIGYIPIPMPILISSQVQDDKIAYLTFDDGPSTNTSKILDILDEYKIHATFFVIGNNSKFYRNTIKEIWRRGNTIGNHTYSHDYRTLYSSVDDFNKDLKKNEDNLYSILGYRPNIFRFPGGSNNEISYNYGGRAIMKNIIDKIDKAQYQYYDWNVSSEDAVGGKSSKNKIIYSVTNGAKNKKTIIILCHDTNQKTTTVEALPTIIKNLKNMGFKFETLDKYSSPIQFKK